MVVVAAFFAAAGFCACDKEDDSSNEVELVVASTKAISGDRSVLVVRPGGGDWTILDGDIVGFQYEEGCEYRLKVRRITPPLESSKTAAYELVKQLSKEKKTTIFDSFWCIVSNLAHAEGVELSSEEIAVIETDIKQSSPFDGVSTLTLDYTDFYAGSAPVSRDCLYRTDTGGSGHCNITRPGKVEQVIAILTFDFDGERVVYEYTRMESNQSGNHAYYLLLDLTSKYQTQYPGLELAQSGIGLGFLR